MYLIVSIKNQYIFFVNIYTQFKIHDLNYIVYIMLTVHVATYQSGQNNG